MKILVVGAGAREHALVWRLTRDVGVQVLCAPGNAAIAEIATCLPVASTNVDGLLALAAAEGVELTIVGPEAPLAVGIADRFAAAGRPILGPSRAAARLETSKAFAKSFMARHHVPTARFQVCENADAARRAVAEFGLPVVLKADGLAAGKGVVVAESWADAEAAIDAAMVARAFGDAGDRLVVEEFLQGSEASFFVLCDGTRAAFIGSAQDHKRVFDDDRGPNTGGMGAFAPAVVIDSAAHERVQREIVEPVLAGMAAEGTPFCGFLYVGLMMTARGPQVIEFNVRFGDPEAQVVFPSISQPLGPVLMDAAQGRLTASAIARSSDRFVGVVLASRGYPSDFQKGVTIEGLDAAASLDAVIVFHAGTTRVGSQWATSGGRVLTVVGRGPDFESAIGRAYAGVDRIRFDGCHFRTDIGRKALGVVPR